MTIPKGGLDSMLIQLRKLDEDEASVFYEFASDYYIQNPKNRHGGIVYATFTGQIGIDKKIRECTVITEMPHDRGHMAPNAIRSILKNTSETSYPDSFIFATG